MDRTKTLERVIYDDLNALIEGGECEVEVMNAAEDAVRKFSKLVTDSKEQSNDG